MKTVESCDCGWSNGHINETLDEHNFHEHGNRPYDILREANLRSDYPNAWANLTASEWGCLLRHGEDDCLCDLDKNEIKRKAAL